MLTGIFGFFLGAVLGFGLVLAFIKLSDPRADDNSEIWRK